MPREEPWEGGITPMHGSQPRCSAAIIETAFLPLPRPETGVSHLLPPGAALILPSVAIEEQAGRLPSFRGQMKLAVGPIEIVHKKRDRFSAFFQYNEHDARSGTRPFCPVEH